MTQTDYIIVGAGSAGCALAARLTEDAAVRVTVLEAGGPDTAEAISRSEERRVGKECRL